MHFICPKCKNECSSRLTVCPICGINFSEWIEKKKKDEKNTFLNQDSNIGKKANVIYSFEYGTKVIKTHSLKDKALDIVKVIIPETVKTIEEDAFWFFKNLETIEFEEAKKDITIELEDGAFNGLVTLKRLKMPNVIINFKELFGPTIINLEELELFANEHYEMYDVFNDDFDDFFDVYCEEIRSNEFENCNGIKKIIIGKGIEYISNEAFKNCGDLESIVCCNELIEIGDNAFEGCANLKKIDLPDSLKKIGDNAFKNCYNLDKVKISPETLIIGKNVFENCNINEIECPDIALEGNEYLNNDKTKLIYNSSAIIFDKKMKDGVFRKSEYKRINIPEGIEKIPNEAFREMRFLEEVIFPKSLKVIGERAFQSCIKLKRVVFPNGIECINRYAFYECNIEEVVIPKSLEELGWHAFSKTPIKKIQILGVVNKIETEVFEWYSACHIECPILPFNRFCSFFDYNIKEKNEKNIIITGNSNIIPNSYFKSEGVNSDITIKAPVKIIEKNAFEDSNFKNIILPDTILTIGEAAFRGCKSNKITLPNTVKTIGRCAFYECKNLKKIVLPRDLETIEYGAFKGCDSLKEVFVSDNIKKVHDESFLIGYNYNLTFVVSSTIKNISYFENIYHTPWTSNYYNIRFCGTKKQWKKVIKNDKHIFKGKNVSFDE